MLQQREQYAPFWQNQGRKTALGTSAYEKSQRNEDILACSSVITGVRRGWWMFLIALSSALLLVLISSLWHEGGAVAPPVRPRLRLPLLLLLLSHTSLWLRCATLIYVYLLRGK